MLELYQAYADYGDMMDLTEAMLAGVVEHCLGTKVIERLGTTLDFNPPFQRVAFVEGIKARTGLDLRDAPDQAMRLSSPARRRRC